jgi:hypothetical protein
MTILLLLIIWIVRKLELKLQINFYFKFYILLQFFLTARLFTTFSGSRNHDREHSFGLLSNGFISS